MAAFRTLLAVIGFAYGSTALDTTLLTTLTTTPLPPLTNASSLLPVTTSDLLTAGLKGQEGEGVDEGKEYEELPVPLAQTGSNEGYVRYDGTYMLNDDKGVGCVMAYFKAKMEINYYDTAGNMKSVMIYQPDDDNVKISGLCDRTGQESQIDASWAPSYVLSLKFGQDDIKDSWFVSRFSLTYDTTDDKFENPAPGQDKITVSSKEGLKFWQTSNAKSFRCLLLHDIALTDALNNTARLHFDEVRVQAFCEESIFRRPKHCIHRVHRNEMVPVTAGGVLAGTTLLTIMFYGIFRYFKIKKVQYDTMQ